MVELLSRHTDMSLHRVESGMVVEPNSVYLIPPKAVMTITDQGVLELRAYERDEANRLPIDAFFESLATSFGSQSAAIVLSGTGRDGSRGVQAISEADGLVLVQSEDSAEFSGMPHQAIATRVASQVLPPARMPAVLRSWCAGEEIERPEQTADPTQRILTLLMQKFNIDFASYKMATVQRRIERRRHALEMNSLEEYADFVVAQDDELDQLQQDLLIGVTSFFPRSRCLCCVSQRVTKIYSAGRRTASRNVPCLGSWLFDR